MPYGCHGWPQWKLPPKYSNVIQCMCPSTTPPTLEYESGLTRGLPVAFSSASGKVAQPCAAANLTVVFLSDADLGAMVNAPPPASSTTKSAAGLGWSARASEPSPFAAR